MKLLNAVLLSLFLLASTSHWLSQVASAQTHVGSISPEGLATIQQGISPEL